MGIRTLGVAAAVVVCAGISTATPVHAGRMQEGLPDTNAIPPAMVDAGRQVFHGPGTCFACHGPSLEGGPIAPTLKPHAWKDAPGGTLPAIYSVVTHGVPGTVMVSHPGGISNSEAVRVAVYVWSVGHRGAKP